jgi:hypothetical protein
VTKAYWTDHGPWNPATPHSQTPIHN